MRPPLKQFVVASVVLFLSLFIFVAPSSAVAEGIHWYNLGDASSRGPYCDDRSEEIVADFEFNVLTLEEYKEEIYELSKFGTYSILKVGFECSSHNVFSLKEKDLLMARALRKYVKLIQIYGYNDKIVITLLEAAQQLESQYLGIPGGL